MTRATWVYTIEQRIKLWECPDLGAGDKIKWI